MSLEKFSDKIVLYLFLIERTLKQRQILRIRAAVILFCFRLLCVEMYHFSKHLCKSTQIRRKSLQILTPMQNLVCISPYRFPPYPFPISLLYAECIYNITVSFYLSSLPSFCLSQFCGQFLKKDIRMALRGKFGAYRGILRKGITLPPRSPFSCTCQIPRRPLSAQGSLLCLLHLTC